MNDAPSHFNSSLESWQIHARAACYETDLQTKQKSESIFYDFSQCPEINTLVNLINDGSDTLVFVVFSYLAKYPQHLTRTFQNVAILISRINSWEFKLFTFVRANHPPFQKYVTRTIMMSLGTFLKIIYEKSTSSNQLLDFLGNLQANFFKLYLLKSFVDAVEVVDYSIGYMRYRLMVYSFQDTVIPMICDILMPYFQKIEEGMQISQLSLMHEQLKVDDNEMTNHSKSLSITNQQELQSDLVFLLLQKIVEFNYNITYSEYQSDQPIETCLISFPQRVAEKILNQSFLNALFFIIEKVSDAKLGQRKHQYLQIALSCIAKMMQSRLTYLKEDVKKSFVFHGIKGITDLLLKCQSIGSEALLKGILICNKKLFMNCELSYLKTISRQLSQNYEPLYDIYISNLTNVIVFVVSKSRIQVDNHLLLQALELSNKLILSHGLKMDGGKDMQFTFFSDFAKSVITAFLSNLYQPYSIFPSYKINSVSDCKIILTEIFQNFKKLAANNFIFLFEILQQKIGEFKNPDKPSLINFANLLFLLSQMIDHNYLQRNILFHESSNVQYKLLAGIINKVIITIKLYCTTSRISFLEATYIDTAIIIFTEALAIDFLVGFQHAKNLQIKQKLFKYMVYGQERLQFQQIRDSKSEQTIQTFLQILTEYIKSPTQEDKEQILVQYSLDAVQKCINKIRWRLRPEIYQKMKIVQYLVNFFQSIFYNRYNIYKNRSRFAKIVASLTLESSDQYKHRAMNFFKILKTQPYNTIQYDLIGLFQGVQTHVIIKFLYNNLSKHIELSNVLYQLFEVAKRQSSENQFQDLCKLIKILLYNKYLRPQSTNILYRHYEMLLPFLNYFLRQVAINEINMDLWQNSLPILLDLFRLFASGSHINIFFLNQLVRNSPKNSDVDHVMLFLQNIITIQIILMNRISQYPQLQIPALSLNLQISKCLLGYIFKDTGRLVLAFTLLVKKTIDLTINYINMMIHGNSNLDDKLIILFDILQFTYTYMKLKSKVPHQTVIYDNIKGLFNSLEQSDHRSLQTNRNYQLISSLFHFLLSNNKNNVVFIRKIGKLLFQLSSSFYYYMMNALQRLQLSCEKIAEADSFLKSQDEQSMIDRLKSWTKELDMLI